MNPEQQRIAIAEACGWKRHPQDKWLVTDPKYPDSVQPLSTIPDYLNDLNAMHEAVMTLCSDSRHDFGVELRTIAIKNQEWSCCDDEHWSVAVNATAAQRAEAFLKTLNLWTP